MSGTWLSVRVELVSGNGTQFWPRPGRVLAAAPEHRFVALAQAIDLAFARWDRAHDYQFWLADGQRAGDPDPMSEDDEDMENADYLKLARLSRGDRFAYAFGSGGSWLHLCTVGPERLDPAQAFRDLPDRPTPYLGWGIIPDQYGRSWDGDGPAAAVPANPHGRDLPDLGPWRRTG